MSIKRYVRNKHTIITSRLARAFLMAKEGDSIPTISDYAQIFSVGSGTVQSAIQQLKQEGAIEIKTRGFLGSYLAKLDYKKLWELSEFGVLLGLFPLSERKEMNAIAKKIRSCFSSQNIPIHISFMPGSINRIHTLINEKCDFVVISELAFLQAVKDEEPVEKVLDLGEGTYYQEMGLLIKRAQWEKNHSNREIGIDAYSYDHVAIMKILAKEMGCSFRHIEKTEIINSLKKGEVQAVITDKIEIGTHQDEFTFCPFPEAVKKQIKAVHNGVVVVRTDNPELRKILAKKLTIQFQNHSIKKGGELGIKS